MSHPRRKSRPVRLPLAALTAAGCLVAPAAPAAAAGPAGVVTIDGRGFGHGVGMSQYGAYGFAQHGYDYRRILAHYYRGTAIGAVSTAQEVTVALASGRRSITVAGASRAGDVALDAGRVYRLSASRKGGVAIIDDAGERVGRVTGGAFRVENGGAPVQLMGRSGDGLSDARYRGALVVRPAGPLSFDVDNAVGLEDYLRGVVGAESPSGWPAAALQAQAVAARTYAVATGGGLHADTRSQVYHGTAAETAATDSAVASTSGQVVTYRGVPIVAYFFSTSGGRTESVQNGFPGSTPVPYLTSVPDPYDAVSPKHTWRKRMPLAEAEARLGPHLQGHLRKIVILRRGHSRRIVRARIVGTAGATVVDGATLKERFGLYDTWARFSVLTTAARRTHVRRATRIRVLPAGRADVGAPVPTPAEAADDRASGWAFFRAVAAAVPAPDVPVVPALAGTRETGAAGLTAWATDVTVRAQQPQRTTGTALAAPTPATRPGFRRVTVRTLRGRLNVTGRRVGGTVLRVERSRRGRWSVVAHARATRRGTFAVRVAKPGVYRVRAGRLTGPRVSLP